jgi:hypothetical protein
LIGLNVFPWVGRRRFGPSRLTPAGPDPRPGETLKATLEAGPGLVQAREVRLELVEIHRATFTAAKVRTTATVPVWLFQVVPEGVRVPVSLAVPADAWASFKRKELGFSLLSEFFIGMRETEHTWEVRAAADVEGASYRARFPVTVAPLTPVEAPPSAENERAYTPRPIVIPPSDKIRA